MQWKKQEKQKDRRDGQAILKSGQDKVESDCGKGICVVPTTLQGNGIDGWNRKKFKS